MANHKKYTINIYRLGIFRWHWAVYSDPLLCKVTDPHGKAPFRWVAKYKVRRAIKQLDNS